MGRAISLSSNLEDYLETIADLYGKTGWARVKDISQAMEVKASSVNSAIKALAGLGYVEYEKYGRIELTEKGRQKARAVQKKHDLLVLFLTRFLKVSAKVAEKDACKMEHVMSEQTIGALIRFMQKEGV